MKEVSVSTLSDLMMEQNASTLLISAPNYEPRSILPEFTSIQKLTSDQWSGHLLVIQIASSERRVEPLELLNRLNTESFDGIDHKKSIKFNIHRVKYPYLDNRLQHELENAIRHLQRPYRMIIDITALPRPVIADLMDFIQDHSDDVDKVFLIYTWAGGYPRVTHPTATGDLIGIRSQTSLHKLLGRTRKPAALVFPSRQGFDAQQVADAFHECGERIKVAALFDGDDPLLSLDALRANANLLGERNLDIQYYHSLEQAYNLINTWALECINEGHDALFIAPFGPKPIVAWSWLHLSKIAITWDILFLKERTLLTTYSFGRGRTSLFELSPQDLAGRTAI